MARRLKPTLIDYLVIAINPALIMLLVGSLVYFLLELFYQGQYPERLHYCLSLFIFGAVLISRISMEEGWEHAAPFGAALAVVVALAMHRFVRYEGTNLVQIGWLMNYALMAITWWCAHKLTWDCTLMDETQDASGEGLLQTVGIDTDGTDELKASEVDQKPPQSNKAPVPKEPPKSWWQTMVERRRRPHAPGVWVVYFSLAALPLFGIGQAFIPAANEESRRYSFELLCVYVASGLGLLLTTSFLGLRRYLRQRRLEMPAPMVGTWLTIGCLLIFALLLFAAMLPRPNAEYSISQFPFSFLSENHDASKYAAGKDGTKDDSAESGQGKNDESRSEDLKSGGAQPDQQRENSTVGDEDGTANRSEKSPGDQESDGQNPEAKERGESQENSSGGAEKENSQTESNSSKSEVSSAQSPQASQQSPPIQPPPVTGFLATLVPMLKAIFYGALILLAAWWSWRHRAELLAWLQNLLNGLSEFWKNLFRVEQGESEASVLARPRKPFAEYPNPYRNGMADRLSPEELVRYTFEALEAWAREQGWPRAEDQTVYEFARQAAGRDQRMAIPVRQLADLYSRVAYAAGPLSASSVSPLPALWEFLRKDAVNV